jgi:hypothetical protein
LTVHPTTSRRLHAAAAFQNKRQSQQAASHF